MATISHLPRSGISLLPEEKDENVRLDSVI